MHCSTRPHFEWHQGTWKIDLDLATIAAQRRRPTHDIRRRNPSYLDDLYRVEGKAELIEGRIVRMASGDLPGEVALNIAISLREHVRRVGKGLAHGDGVGFAVPELPSGRESFSPDASYYTGPRPANRMRFIQGAPDFAAEIRSGPDYGAAAEAQLADKRADYFAAGTQVVWDVDPVAECIHVYRAADPFNPITTYHRGEIAEAAQAVPDWQMSVDDVFSVQSS